MPFFVTSSDVVIYQLFFANIAALCNNTRPQFEKKSTFMFFASVNHLNGPLDYRFIDQLRLMVTR